MNVVHVASRKEAAMNIFEAVATRDARTIIAIVDPAFKEAAREASQRAHALGIEVADGRADEEREPKKISRAA